MKNTREAYITSYAIDCDGCGRKHHIGVEYTAWFMTMDGGDCLSDRMCWHCEIKGRINRLTFHQRVFLKRVKDTVFFVKELRSASTRDLLDLIKIGWRLSK